MKCVILNHQEFKHFDLKFTKKDIIFHWLCDSEKKLTIIHNHAMHRCYSFLFGLTHSQYTRIKSLCTTGNSYMQYCWIRKT